jgi:uncharacterized protein YndB with AHSA1/START domain
MTERSVTHATFVIERNYAASPARVFAAFADPAAKKRWFAGPDEMGAAQHEIDFRIGGRELNRGGPPGGPVYTFDALYQDIVPNQRIVTTYEMLMADTRISVSLATVELTPAGAGTRLVYTEQGAFLDGHDTAAQREHGTRELLEALGAEVERQPVPEPAH